MDAKGKITFQWIDPCQSARLKAAQQTLKESVESFGLESDLFHAGPQMVKFADILWQGRRNSTGDAFVWCNSDVILKKNPFKINDLSKVHGFHRTEVPSGEITYGVDMYLIPNRIWDEVLSKDIPDLWCGAATIDWWVSRACQLQGIYENHTGYIDHVTHERSQSSGGGNYYFRYNVREYNRWARRNGAGTLDMIMHLPVFGEWNNSVRDWIRRMRKRKNA